MNLNVLDCKTDERVVTSALCYVEHGKIVCFGLHFCLLPLCDYSAICCMNGKTIQCSPNPSQHVPIYLTFFNLPRPAATATAA